jgi:hypothetical protein
VTQELKKQKENKQVEETLHLEKENLQCMKEWPDLPVT